jgi:hypothetical protein
MLANLFLFTGPDFQLGTQPAGLWGDNCTDVCCSCSMPCDAQFRHRGPPPAGVLLCMRELQWMRMCGNHPVIFAYVRLPLCEPCAATFTGYAVLNVILDILTSTSAPELSWYPDSVGACACLTCVRGQPERVCPSHL